MRTLCKAITCLCLFASLSFANEIPLILEETIQLPQATPYWDVMPKWDGDYAWTALTTAPYDSITVYCAQSLDEDESYFSLAVERYTYPVTLYGYLNPEYEAELLVGLCEEDTSFVGFSGFTLSFAAYDIASGSALSEPVTYSVYDYELESTHRLNFVSALPIAQCPPPGVATNLFLAVTFDQSRAYREIGPHGNIVNWSLDGISLSTGYPNNPHTLTQAFSPWRIVGCTQWNGDTFIGGWGREHGTSGYNFGPYINLVDLSSDILVPLTIETDYLANESSSGVCCIYDMMHEYPSIVMNTPSESMTAWNSSDTQSAWSISSTYKQIQPAFALMNDYSEQVLAYDTTRQVFDIIKIEDGSIWGQTSELPSGYNEMKIIGRYHNNYRRLAVRYDDEIRIYSFGDPIIEAADDTPTIPQSYLFTAYPNPFNPSTTLEFSLPVYEDVKLSVFNTLGQEVAVLADKQHSPGKYSYTFDATDLPSGIFFAHLSAGSINSTKKLVLLK